MDRVITREKTMEVIAIIVVVIVVVLVIGSFDNARPVSEWSDEKLIRMYPKLLRAGNAQTNQQKANEHYKKAKEVEQEIKKRNLLREAHNTMQSLRPTIDDLSNKLASEIKKITSEKNCSMDEAREILESKIDQAISKYKEQGMTDDQAEKAALKEFLAL